MHKKPYDNRKRPHESLDWPPALFYAMPTLGQLGNRMTNYYRVMLGAGSVHAAEAFAGGFVGADYGIEQDLTGQLPNEWREFNRTFIPIYLTNRPTKTKIAAGLACGALWTIAKGIRKGDYILSPDGMGNYRIGDVSGDYYYQPGQILFHRRPVNWSKQTIQRAAMSSGLQRSTGATGTVCDISQYREEIERLIAGVAPPALVSTDPDVNDASAFALEKHLEDFLVQNWLQTELGREYNIFEEDGQKVGQQYATDTGPVDILAVSKDRSELLVVELKKGRASDSVVGQILRYMGYVKDVIAEEGQKVKGAIIALEDDQRIRRALAVTPDVTFFRYQVNFKLLKS